MGLFLFWVIFIRMSKKSPLKENNFDTAQAGSAGAISVAPGWGTFASPQVSQNPDQFGGNKALGSHSNTATGTAASSSMFTRDVDQIYSKQDTPSPDEIMTGLKYELGNMIKKNKARAKEIVLTKLKQDPHFYGKLGMLNIDDKEMMNQTPPTQTTQDPLKETIAILDAMIAAKGKKAEPSDAIKEALRQTREAKAKRYTVRR